MSLFTCFSVSGPNSEIEWNKEGARGFSILARSTPQTALSLLADKAAELGDELNAKLPQPANTQRNHVLRSTDDVSEPAPKIITADPVTFVHPFVRQAPDSFHIPFPQLQMKVENKRQPTSSAKPKPPPIDWSVANKSRKRGPNKLNSPNSRIQQLYNSHNPKVNAAPPQRKSTQGSTAPQTSLKSATVTNRRRKSELPSPNVGSIEPISAAVHSTEHSIRDNEYQLQEVEVNSVPLHSHHYKFNTTPNDAIVQMAAAKESQVKTQPTVISSVPNAVPNMPRIGATKSGQAQIIYQQQPSAPTSTKATPSAVSTTKIMLDNSKHSNGPSQCESQFASCKNTFIVPSATIAPTPTTTTATAAATSTQQRIPPKINILSQQTIAKSNFNFVPLADNKIIIKSDGKLANAFKSQKIQMIPGQMSSSSSPSHAANKMHPQNNLIIRGTSQHNTIRSAATTTAAKVFSVPLNSNHQNAQAFYVNMPTTQSPTSNASIPVHEQHTIEKFISSEETPVEMLSAETDEYIIEETTGTAYELVEQNVADDTAAYVTTTTKNEPTPAKRAKYSANNENRSTHDNRQRTSFVTPKLLSNALQQYRTHVANNELVSTIIYEEHPANTNWEYELDYGQGGKANGNGQTIVTTGHAGDVIVEDDATEYHDSNIIYTEEEIIDDENVLQEEYVTTEVFSPNGTYDFHFSPDPPNNCLFSPFLRR